MSRIEVVALEAGHDGRVYRSSGERWFVPAEDFVKDEKSGKITGHTSKQTWFVPVEQAPPAPEKPKDKRPPGAGPVKGSGVVE